MDRDKTVSAIISKFSELKKEFNELFSEERIIEKAELMIEEFFESKFNPFLQKLNKDITSLPLDDYTLIAIDLWTKDLNKKNIENEDLSTFAEVKYINQKYLPKLIDELKNLKLKILEDLFHNESSGSKNSQNILINYRKQVLSVNALAFLFTQLHNFNVIPNTSSLEESINLYCDLIGVPQEQIKEIVNQDNESMRLFANANVEELQVLSKILKSILSRTENQIHQSR
jgi:hypothetical protein